MKYPEPDQIGVMPAYGVFARPAIGCENVEGLQIDNFKAQLAPGVPAPRFEQVKGLVIHNSPQLAPGAAETK